MLQTGEERKKCKKRRKMAGVGWTCGFEEIPLMVVFFATSMGAQIPVIAEKSLSTCGFKKFLYRRQLEKKLSRSFIFKYLYEGS
jgi:hypothetical protein